VGINFGIAKHWRRAWESYCWFICCNTSCYKGSQMNAGNPLSLLGVHAQMCGSNIPGFIHSPLSSLEKYVSGCGQMNRNVCVHTNTMLCSLIFTRAEKIEKGFYPYYTDGSLQPPNPRKSAEVMFEAGTPTILMKAQELYRAERQKG
jgi:hypothetical protein